MADSGGQETASEWLPITRFLRSARSGDDQAMDRLYQAVYPALHKMASSRPGVYRGATISPTVVVNELFLKIADSTAFESNDRQHFFATCARAMRFIVADFARSALALKNGGEYEHCRFTTELAEQPDHAQELLDLHSALDDLDRVDPRQRQLVELKFFGGLNYAEIAELQQCSERTIKREWVKARAFLVARSAAGMV